MSNSKNLNLALYYFDGCPFCTVVRRAIDQLGLDVELRNTMTEPKYREELLEARKRGTVPVLKITNEQGSETWMPESMDIVEYLRSLK
ncbi:glutathione S-transferase N-terminal domain-containing protein [Vibrio ishigakensis]|uniref:glutathione S-transferase N-terminal domain-containing protein n=1 Tax=Vibrio ishigakensis TaxID=1481914 RepID=UPI0021C38E0C|nr:glutathione S-transferase N-terminal domain-containing protein [Vibrio ishigakensis]